MTPPRQTAFPEHPAPHPVIDHVDAGRADHRALRFGTNPPGVVIAAGVGAVTDIVVGAAVLVLGPAVGVAPGDGAVVGAAVGVEGGVLLGDGAVVAAGA